MRKWQQYRIAPKTVTNRVEVHIHIQRDGVEANVKTQGGHPWWNQYTTLVNEDASRAQSDQWCQQNFGWISGGAVLPNKSWYVIDWLSRSLTSREHASGYMRRPCEIWSVCEFHITSNLLCCYSLPGATNSLPHVLCMGLISPPACWQDGKLCPINQQNCHGKLVITQKPNWMCCGNTIITM